jgi:hypothetical protein
MTKAEFEKLVTEYGDLSMDCGVWSDFKNNPDTLTRFQERTVAAKQAVLDAYQQAVLDEDLL